MESKMTGDEIVISGISGKFPNCESINELQMNLFKKIDCVSDSKSRWNYEHPNIPPRIGVMKQIDEFDAIFFGINGKLVNYMDPMFRLITENTYEAIVDAGINPGSLKKCKTAVFTGSAFSESEKGFFFCKKDNNGFGMLGAGRTMLANRVSFFFDLVGPSGNIDSSCCGGATALEEGFKAIKDGRAENAIIGATNVVLHPQMSMNLFLLGLLSPDGVTKSFDNAADGYTRSEGVVVLFLQKARDAKRIYAEIKNCRYNYGDVNDSHSFFYPTYQFQTNFMKSVLKECGLKGNDISYIEADGSGIKDVDANEIMAIDNVYNQELRKSPLLIGSIKSNIGSSSAVNPLNGIIKVIIAMETGYIPPNLHFQKSSIPAVQEGRCKVVTESTPWSDDYAVVNSLALTGSSANIVLKKYKKEKKNQGKPDDNLLRLVTVSGCTKEAVDVILSHLENREVDVEMLQLLYDVFEKPVRGHLYRGYTVLPLEGLQKTKIQGIELTSGIKKEIWYMFSGMGSQWIGMGKDLLQIPIFAESINKCNKVLQPRGIDILKIITENDSKMFDNIVNSFVGIAAIQIGLVDLLTAIGLKPDFLIGHSVGELGCAYADGSFTAEQMILSALSRGLASIETEMPKGSMAAVGLGYEEIKHICPSDIDVACHNSENNCTISGPADSMRAFVADLKGKNIFAKEVACSDIAYHSRYIAAAGEKLRKYLLQVIPNPKPRSQRWISSSVPRNMWNSARARLSSADYHTNNLLNSVLFAETAKIIPSNAIVIEIAPHGLLQAIVRKSLPETVINIPLTKKYQNCVSFLFEALGKLYNSGCDINISNLYPKITYPVSQGTPSISSLIRWDNSAKWQTQFFKQEEKIKTGELSFIINLNDEKWKYLKYGKINKRIVFHTSVYLNLVWEVLKSLKNSESVIYHNVQIHQHLVEIPDDENIILIVMVQKASGMFEVTNNNILLCSGIIQSNDHPQFNKIPKFLNSNQLSENDIYSELKSRGLQYSEAFKTILKASNNSGILIWKNWTTFIEGMIQIFILTSDVRSTQVPIKIRKIVINKHQTLNTREFPVEVCQSRKSVNAGIIQMEGIVLKSLRRQVGKNIVVEKIIPCTDEFRSNLNLKIKPNKICGMYQYFPLDSNLQKVSNWTAKQNDSQLEWIEDLSIANTKNKIRVEYSGISQQDIILGTSETKNENFGQYSGIDNKNTRIMGISTKSSLSNFTISDDDFKWKIPENWSLEDGATVPLPYTIAYLSIILKGELEKEKSIFIFNGTCSIGQAAINLALNIKSQIFAGYANCNGKKFLENNYNVQTINIGGSFPEQIISLQKGKGIDLIIYNGNDLNKFENCCKFVNKKGKIIIIGNLQDAYNKSMGMLIYDDCVKILSIIPRKLLNLDVEIKRNLSEILQNGIDTGIVKPLPKRVYTREMLGKAFTDSETSIEKIIVKVQSENENKALAIPRFICKNEASYLIIEGLSNFGLELGEFLVSRGAKNIIILSESKNTRAYSNYRINLWTKSGVSVRVDDEFNFSNRQSVNEIFKNSQKIDAIFDLQQIENLSNCSKFSFKKFPYEELNNLSSNLEKLTIFSTCKNSEDNVDQILLEEIKLVEIFQKKSKETKFPGLLILLGPIEGIAKCTNENETKPLLSIADIMEQMDKILRENASIVSVSCKLEKRKEIVDTENEVIVEKTEEQKFLQYITKVQRSTPKSYKYEVEQEDEY
ncbi:fatty acid synthase-like [Leptopilina boulardi]|uniref:fatty acid synthase-like n=1 Tax=Leptopilina boulardi TaxID=63433 RepID=UPI0021F5F571|nr:fatty acid synthase-like [Leptopilina boulardi]